MTSSSASGCMKSLIDIILQPLETPGPVCIPSKVFHLRIHTQRNRSLTETHTTNPRRDYLVMAQYAIGLKVSAVQIIEFTGSVSHYIISLCILAVSDEKRQPHFSNWQ